MIDKIKSALLGVFTENAEVVIDQLTNDEIIKSIPVLGNIYKLYDIHLTIRDGLFLRKIEAFLNAYRGVTKEQKERFINENLLTKEQREYLGEKLIFVIDKVDTKEKSNLIGFAFKEYLLNEISAFELYELLDGISNIKTHYISRFINFSLKLDWPYIDDETLKYFEFQGLKKFSSSLIDDENRVVNDQEIERDLLPIPNKEELTKLGELLSHLYFKYHQYEIKQIIIRDRLLNRRKFENVKPHPIASYVKGISETIRTDRKLVEVISLDEYRKRLFKYNLEQLLGNISKEDEYSMYLYDSELFSGKVSYYFDTKDKVYVYESKYQF